MALTNFYTSNIFCGEEYLVTIWSTYNTSRGASPLKTKFLNNDKSKLCNSSNYNNIRL